MVRIETGPAPKKLDQGCLNGRSACAGVSGHKLLVLVLVSFLS